MSNPSKQSKLKPAAPAPAQVARLKAERVQLLLEELQGWRVLPGGGTLYRTFRFPGAASALAFTQLVAVLAAESGHAPCVSLSGNRVVCRLTTPTAGGLTLRDFELAKRIGLQA